MFKFKNIGLTAKLTVAVLASSILVYLVVFGLAYYLAERVITGEVEEIGQSIVDSAVKRIDDVVGVVARTTKSLDFVLKGVSENDDQLFQIISFLLSDNEELSGLSISFEPYAEDKKDKYYSPYCYKMGEGVKCEMLGSERYDYFNMDWYNKAKITGRAVWTDPYFDTDCSNIFLISHSAPFFNKTKEGDVFQGVVSADISIDWIQNKISKSEFPKKGYVFLISGNGTFITFPEDGYSLKKNIWDVATELGDKKISEIASEMTSGKTGISKFKDIVTGEKSWIFYEPVKLSDWSIGVIFEEKELFSDVMYMANRIVVLLIFGTVILFAIVFIISRRITKPLVLLSKTTKDIAHGNLDTIIPATARKDEVGVLARSFTSMQHDLKKYINELTETVTRQERIGNELRIAHDIQQSIVPKEFPSFGLSRNVKAFGKLVSAREVGGDLYDCFDIDEHHTFFVVGDVSDKGVHASLIMAIVSTLIRGLCKNLKNPDNMMGIVNKQILKRNRESMFVTLFCGVLNNETGEFRYASAGHVPPVLIRKGGMPELITKGAGMALGVSPNAEYKWTNIKLHDGDKVFMYTDGVTDATDEKGELFGEKRLLNNLETDRGKTEKELVDNVFEAVKDYALNCPLPDDIAILAFSFSACSASVKTVANMKITNSPSEISRVAKMIDEFGSRCRCNNDMLNEINLVIEEVVINIIRFAYDDKKEHTIDISMEISNDNLVVKITDDGRPFDLSKAPDPDTSLAVEDRPIGGLGIFFAKKFTDKVYYERVKDHNRLTLVKVIKENSDAKSD